MIRTFKDRRTAQIHDGIVAKRVPSDLLKTVRRKLRMIHNATVLDDLRVPPANRLELLKGDRRGQHSIRVNDQFRICFVWRDDGAYEVEFTDYHA